MDCKVIKIKSYNDIESLKIFILQKLKLVDYTKDYVAEFEERLKNYIDKNKNLTVLFQFDIQKFEKDLKFNLSLTDRPYPDNFEMGNPLNRWIFESIPKTTDEMNIEAIDSQAKCIDKLIVH